MFRIGQGFDVHAFAEGRPLMLGGVKIPFKLGLLGHSDADVLVHAIMDAILGALALGDIGTWFPDNDKNYKNADSLQLLLKIMTDQRFAGWKVVNLDSVIITENPKLMRPGVYRYFQRQGYLYRGKSVQGLDRWWAPFE